MQIRRADERGTFDHGWLRTSHTFSFADYYDPRHMGFRALRVVNEDRVQPGRGFGTHPHQDMEIVSYVLSGALSHRDSMGNGSVIRPGEVQRMSAGTGVRHSEKNDSASEVVHFLQIWIVPEAKNLAPGYEQKAFAEADRRGRLLLVGARDGRDGAVTIHQDVAMYAGLFDRGESVIYELSPGRHAWIHVARGTVEIDGAALAAGDAAAISDASRISIAGVDAGEVLLFDLA